ncbi:MAG: DUF924 family protein [Pseudomonadota bacterium]
MAETDTSLIQFWTDEVGEAGWYKSSDAVDAAIRDRFGALWERGRAMDADPLGGNPLAAMILFDQFPRNMFRGQAQAFATDPLARRLARAAIDAGADLATQEPERQFFYMPFEHSEELADQDAAVELIESRTTSAELLLHARAHRRVIRTFGRFPFRNAALGRETTAEEQAFLEDGAYGGLVGRMRAEGAANPQPHGEG